jgi:hypothetical protein
MRKVSPRGPSQNPPCSSLLLTVYRDDLKDVEVEIIEGERVYGLGSCAPPVSLKGED